MWLSAVTQRSPEFSVRSYRRKGPLPFQCHGKKSTIPFCKGLPFGVWEVEIPPDVWSCWCACILAWMILAGNLESCSGLLWCLSSHLCMLSRFSYVRLCATPWTVARQAPLSMGFSRQEYWSGEPFPPPGNLLDPGIELESHVSCIGGQVLSLELSYIGPHFSSRSAVSPVPRWHLNHPCRMPPTLQHLAGDFADGRTSWEMLEPGQSRGELPCASEADAEWPSASAACLPCAGCDLIGLDRRWQLWQVVSLMWTLVPSRCSRTASSDSESWAFQLMLLPR